jgi:hypothetical protein
MPSDWDFGEQLDGMRAELAARHKADELRAADAAERAGQAAELTRQREALQPKVVALIRADAIEAAQQLHSRGYSPELTAYFGWPETSQAKQFGRMIVGLPPAPPSTRIWALTGEEVLVPIRTMNSAGTGAYTNYHSYLSGIAMDGRGELLVYRDKGFGFAIFREDTTARHTPRTLPGLINPLVVREVEPEDLGMIVPLETIDIEADAEAQAGIGIWRGHFRSLARQLIGD